MHRNTKLETRIKSKCQTTMAQKTHTLCNTALVRHWKTYCTDVCSKHISIEFYWGESKMRAIVKKKNSNGNDKYIKHSMH